MPRPAAALALAMLALLAAGGWATGCNDLATDCQLDLTCPPAPPPMCSNIFPPGDCQKCLESSCCQELADCSADSANACVGACLLDVWPLPAVCSMGSTKTHLDAVTACMAKSCSPACDPKDECNPVSGIGCSGVGFTCDAVFPGMFVCLGTGGTSAKACETCDNLNGPYCGAGLRCFAEAAQCARYCCSDADCGPSGKCITDPKRVFVDPLAIHGDVVGVCVGADLKTPLCDAPAIAPSKGSCVAGFPG